MIEFPEEVKKELQVLNPLQSKRLRRSTYGILSFIPFFVVTIFTVGFLGNHDFITALFTFVIIPALGFMAYMISEKMKKDTMTVKQRRDFVFFHTYESIAKFVDDRTEKNKKQATLITERFARYLYSYAERKADPDFIDDFKAISKNFYAIILPLIKNEKIKDLSNIMGSFFELSLNMFNNKFEHISLSSFNTILESHLHKSESKFEKIKRIFRNKPKLKYLLLSISLPLIAIAIYTTLPDKLQNSFLQISVIVVGIWAILGAFYIAEQSRDSKNLQSSTD